MLLTRVFIGVKASPLSQRWMLREDRSRSLAPSLSQVSEARPGPPARAQVCRGSGFDYVIQRYHDSVMILPPFSIPPHGVIASGRAVVLLMFLSPLMLQARNPQVSDAVGRSAEAVPNTLESLLASVTLYKEKCTPKDTASCDMAADLARRGLALNRPEQTSGADWKKAVHEAFPVFYSAIALDDVNSKFDNRDAEHQYTEELKLLSDEESRTRGLDDTLELARAYGRPGNAQDLVKAVWFFARAWDYSAPSGQAKIEPALRYCYKKQRESNSLDGLDEVRRQAKDSVFPPQSFEIAPVPPPPRQHRVISPDEIPSCVTEGVEENERIVAGTITEIRPGSPNAPLGSYQSVARATVSADRYVRGAHFPNEAVSLPVDWTYGQSRPWILRKPIWADVDVKQGERLLLAVMSTAEMGTPGDPNEFVATCVLEYDDYAPIVPTIERMVLLDSAEGTAKIAQMKKALSDRTPAVRSLAINYLTSVQLRDPSVRQYVFRHFAPIALDSRNPERDQAFYAIREARDPIAGNTDLNYRILSFVTDRIGDSDPRISSSALQYIYSTLFGGGTYRPDPAKFRLNNREAVLQQLRRQISDRSIGHEAQQLLRTFSAQ